MQSINCAPPSIATHLRPGHGNPQNLQPDAYCRHASMVDDSAEFQRIVRDRYRNGEDLEEDVKKFQLATATSFYKSSVVTRTQYERRYGKELPEGFAFQYVQFRCVHSTRKSVRGKRYRDYDCRARFSFMLKDFWYQRGEFNLVHSHEFDVGNPWLYAGNRRLTKAEEIQVCDLMDTFNNTQMVCQYVASQYGRHLNRSDLWSIKRRHMNRKSEEVLEETNLSEQNDICRPSVPEQNASDIPVNMPDVEILTVAEKDNVQHLALTDRATKLRMAEQVMAEVTTQLCNLGSARYQRMLQSFQLFGELMSTDTEVDFYCKTRHSAEPLPLNNTSDLLRLQGKSPQTLVPRVKTQDGVLLPSSSKNNAMENGGDNTGLCILKPDDEVWPKNPEPVSKRKAPLVQRVTDIPASTAPAGIRFLRLKNATSTKDRGGTHSKRRVATHSAALQNGVCRACSQADDPMQQCAAVSWVLCDVCGSWFHQSCAGFQGKEPFTCAFCNT